MDLKNFLPKKKDDEEYFWSLIIEPEWVSAGIWRLKENKVQVIAISPPSSWNTTDELVTACDASCSSVVQSFPEELTPPTKTVFGVVSSWVDGGEIKSDYINKIKKVCGELSLTPVGFVVMAEALSNYFKSEEGGQVNAIFLGISHDNIEISIFRLGKLIGVSQVARSVSITEDVTEGLSRFYTGEAYPSRMILYNSKEGELDDIKQELIKADWESFKEIRFLHTPKIEIISPERKIYAVCLAGGAEMGEVEKVLPVYNNHQTEEKPEIKDIVNETPLDDAASEENIPGDEVVNVSEPDEDISPEDFGFTVESESVTDNRVGIQKDLQHTREAVPSVEKTKEGMKIENNKIGVRSLFTKFHLPKLRIPLPSFKFKFSTPKPIIMGIVFFLLLGLVFFAFWWFYPKAEVTIYVAPKSINEELEISVDSSAKSSDFNSKIIMGDIVEEVKQSEKSGPVTGTKVVGDKATGEITIYRSGSAINLAKNTLIKGPQGMNFTLDDAITVASGSVLTRGITKAKVTAGEIGAQYNLASGTTFTVSNYSNADMEATNESAFSGGTSREVSAVSENDEKALLTDLQNEMENSLKETLSENVTEDLVIIDDSIDYSVVKKEFDKKVGDEGTSVSLKLEIKAEGVAVRRKDIEELGLNYLNQRVPEGYSLKTDQIESDFTFKDEEDGIYKMQLLISANLLPKVNIDEIRNNITGKYPDTAEKYLNENVPGYVRAVINFKNISLPGRLGTLPRIEDNIDISISAEK